MAEAYHISLCRKQAWHGYSCVERRSPRLSSALITKCGLRLDWSRRGILAPSVALHTTDSGCNAMYVEAMRGIVVASSYLCRAKEALAQGENEAERSSGTQGAQDSAARVELHALPLQASVASVVHSFLSIARRSIRLSMNRDLSMEPSIQTSFPSVSYLCVWSCLVHSDRTSWQNLLKTNIVVKYHHGRYCAGAGHDVSVPKG